MTAETRPWAYNDAGQINTGDHWVTMGSAEAAREIVLAHHDCQDEK